MKLRPTLTQQVVGYVLHQRGASQHPSLRAILVLTDETDAAYLSDLRAALQPHFDTVRLEADVPDVLREADDNYFNYQARPPHPHSYTLPPGCTLPICVRAVALPPPPPPSR